MKKSLSTVKGNLRSSNWRGRAPWLYLGAALALVCIGYMFPVFLSKISAILLYPAHATSLWLRESSASFPQYWRAREELLAELDNLEMKLATELGTQLSVRRLRDENDRLRALLGETVAVDRVLSRVITRPPLLPYDLIQIDKGVDDGVSTGALVYFGYDSIVGLVVYAGQNHSFVELVSSPDFTATAFVLGSNTFLPLEGVGGGMARLRAPQDLTIELGSPVVLPGASGGVYGEVVYAVGEPTQPEQYFYVDPKIGLDNLIYVTVAKVSTPPPDLGLIDENVRQAMQSMLLLDTASTSLPDLSATATVRESQTQ